MSVISRVLSEIQKDSTAWRRDWVGFWWGLQGRVRAICWTELWRVGGSKSGSKLLLEKTASCSEEELGQSCELEVDMARARDSKRGGWLMPKPWGGEAGLGSGKWIVMARTRGTSRAIPSAVDVLAELWWHLIYSVQGPPWLCVENSPMVVIQLVFLQSGDRGLS